MFDWLLRKFELSEVFTFKNSATIASGAYYLFDFATENIRCGRFLPFDYVRIFNMNVTCDIELPEIGRVIPCGSEEVFNKLRTIKLKNLGSDNIIANEIVVTCQGRSNG